MIKTRRGSLPKSFTTSTRVRHSRVSDIRMDPNRKLVRDPSASVTSLEFLKDIDTAEADELDLLEPAPSGIKKLGLNIQFYEIARAVQILLNGNLNATITQLTLLHDMELDKVPVQDALRVHQGYDVLINLLDVSDPRCHIGALRVIQKLSSNNKTRLLLTNLGVITPMMALLKKAAVDVRIHVAKALRELCNIHKAARYVRKGDGIPLLLDSMNLEESLLYTRTDLLSSVQQEDLLLALKSADALKNISKFPKSVSILHKSGFIPIVKKILNGRHIKLLTCTFQLLDQCATVDSVRLSIQVEGMLIALLKGISENDQAMRAACTSTIAQCAAQCELTCHIVRMLKGLPKIVVLTNDISQDTDTLLGITAAVAKLGQDTRNIQKMCKKGLVHNLIRFLKEDRWGEEVISNVLEGLAECARLGENRKIMADHGVVQRTVTKLMGNNPRVLTSAAQCLGTCARDAEVAQLITDCDGMRLLFSIMQERTPSVPATALWALRPIVQYSKDSAEEIRSLVGGLGLLVQLLNVRDIEVLGQACGFVAEVVKDAENLQIMSERGLVRALADCVHETNEQVCMNLAEAIAYSSYLPWNAHEFGLLGVVPVMRNYLISKNVSLHIAAMRALAALTRNPLNCIVLHESDGLNPILNDIASPYEELQDCAMVVVNNMRRVALAAEQRVIDKTDLVALAGGTRKARRSMLDTHSLFDRSSRAYYLAVRQKLNAT